MEQNSEISEKSNSENQITNTYDVRISDAITVRVFTDTRPHNLKISDLQKGLILLHDQTETVGEGTGFGLPVIVCADETRFSSTSKVHVTSENGNSVIRKEFIIDRTARNRFKNVTLENRKARDFLSLLARLYQNHPRLRALVLKDITRNIDIDTAFVKTEPKGKVTVTYTIAKARVSVEADFRSLQTEGMKRIFMLNEQGSRFYRRYVDADGIELKDAEIGAWDDVTTDWAALTLLNSRHGFRLWKRENSILRRGREFLKDSLDWVGLDYELPSNTEVFEYPIEILGT
jgi:hypothetical protein